MNRNEEYQALMRELDTVPDALDGTVERAMRRKNQKKKLGRIFGIPAGSLAACLLGFMLLVNLFPPFAYACGRIPMLKTLAQAVAWSPSLSAAVENEYVQPIEESQTKGDWTATIHYVIVDQKEINIFYSLDFDKELEGRVFAEYHKLMEGTSGTAGSAVEKAGALEQIQISFVDRDVPGEMDLDLAVYLSPEDHEQALVSTDEALFADPSLENGEKLVETFLFHLTFDPKFTAQGETISVNQTFTLDDQTLTLTKVDLYPTHLRVHLEDAQDNLSWLNGLDLYLENERGERFRSRTNGILSTGDADGGEGAAVFWLDSPFFKDCEHLTLYIRQAEWRDKETIYTKLDLKNGTCSPLPPNTEFGGAEKYPSGWAVHFIHPYKGENGMYSMFGHGFRDEAGNEYEIDSVQSTFGAVDPKTGESRDEDTCFTETLPLKGLKGDVAYLKANYNRVTELNPPMSIPIK